MSQKGFKRNIFNNENSNIKTLHVKFNLYQWRLQLGLFVICTYSSRLEYFFFKLTQTARCRHEFEIGNDNVIIVNLLEYINEYIAVIRVQSAICKSTFAWRIECLISYQEHLTFSSLIIDSLLQIGYQGYMQDRKKSVAKVSEVYRVFCSVTKRAS